MENYNYKTDCNVQSHGICICFFTQGSFNFYSLGLRIFHLHSFITLSAHSNFTIYLFINARRMCRTVLNSAVCLDTKPHLTHDVLREKNHTSPLNCVSLAYLHRYRTSLVWLHVIVSRRFNTLSGAVHWQRCRERGRKREK